MIKIFILLNVSKCLMFCFNVLQRIYAFCFVYNTFYSSSAQVFCDAYFKCAESRQLGLDLMVACLLYGDHWHKQGQADVVVGTEHVGSSGLVRT
jgi:hypothetical protein